jgi:succinate dehydrogenase / fumarate reductase, membrane anchor subunit
MTQQTGHPAHPPLRTILARVRGLGSAKEGVGHWWAQRMTALALIPLVLWFVIGVIGHAGADYDTLRAWAGHPFNAALLLLLIGAAFHHATLGLQVVLEDYVHHEGLRIAGIAGIKAVAYLLGAASAIAVLKLAFGG